METKQNNVVLVKHLQHPRHLASSRHVFQPSRWRKLPARQVTVHGSLGNLLCMPAWDPVCRALTRYRTMGRLAVRQWIRMDRLRLLHTTIGDSPAKAKILLWQGQHHCHRRSWCRRIPNKNQQVSILISRFYLVGTTKNSSNLREDGMLAGMLAHHLLLVLAGDLIKLWLRLVLAHLRIHRIILLRAGLQQKPFRRFRRLRRFRFPPQNRPKHQ
mmetsp:Transcript_33920/g.52741  ORF Transcript_33920/g.52741 Transcript_33920/m.52741 type:complete len:214 (-) Transcript_33920:727-1368(-)